MAVQHTITWKKQIHTLVLYKISVLTGRSETFLRARLSEGLTMQQAIERVPGDKAHRKTIRRFSGGTGSEESARRKREKEHAIKHRDLIRRFTCGGLNGRSTA